MKNRISHKEYAMEKKKSGKSNLRGAQTQRGPVDKTRNHLGMGTQRNSKAIVRRMVDLEESENDVYSNSFSHSTEPSTQKKRRKSS